MQKKRFMDRVKVRIRTLHYSRSTENTYCYWIRFYVRFHNMRHPAQMNAKEIASIMTFLAVNRKVSAATQNQSFNALIFLYKKVLDIELEKVQGATRAKQSRRLPVFYLVEKSRLFYHL